MHGKCTRSERWILWDDLREIAESMEGHPWLVGGDFNVVLNERERRGGSGEESQARMGKMLDFAEAINDCQLIDPGYDGLDFTWARGDLFERLDRVLISESWATCFASTRVTVLPRVMSDHGPLLIRCKETLTTTKAPFRFQNMWTRHHLFLPEIKRLWEIETGEEGMRNLQLKLGAVKRGLKVWNEKVFGNIHRRIAKAEAEAARAQRAFEVDPSIENRIQNNKSIAELILCLRMEEDFWRQKAAIRWVTDGERNTKFYQGWVRQKRVR